MADVAPLGLGTKIELGYARIVLDAKVGEGAMGVVWRGWLFYAPSGPRASDAPLPVAVKELHASARMHAGMRQFFKNEAEAIKRTRHPNVVGFYDLFEWGASSTDHGSVRPEASRTLAIVMEFVDGDTLEDVITRNVARARIAGPGALPGMPFQRSWYYFQQLLGALAAVHALGIVHRDVKPSNILVRRDGIVKLTDFGIARLAETEGTPGQHDHEGEFAPGTGPYMSPEQVLSRPLDGRSDLYAAATVLYEMISGRTPFSIENKSELAIRMEQVERTPPPIRTFLTQAPPVLDALFKRALAKDPALRFDGAIQMGEAFRAALGMPDTPVWRAQARFARVAPTLPGEPFRAPERLQTLRDFLIDGYANHMSTAPMPAR